MAARALIFDLDGTVWDSAGWFASALATDAAKVADIRQDLVAGGNIIAAMRNAGLSRERLIRVAQARTGPPPIFEGITDVIAALTERGVPLGIATSLPGSLALPMLDACGLSDKFAVVVHAGICRAAKPSPASILMALKLLGQAPAPDVFYVGDRTVDQVAAARAGVGFAWMRHGYGETHQDAGIVPLRAAELLEL